MNLPSTAGIDPAFKILAMAALLCTSMLPTPAQSIVLRHDRDDAAYQELGAKYPSALRFATGGTGTLVAAAWVLTAAHVVKGVNQDRLKVAYGDDMVAVTEVHIHPGWDGNGEHDIALVKLAQPIEDIEPVAMYQGDDELNQAVTFVGFGDTGNGITGPVTMDHVKRGATNTIFQVSPEWLFFRFDQGEDATDLEGVSGPGDSGGPAYVERDGVVYTVGVSVFGDGDQGPGFYGVLEGYTRVSTHLDWIKQVMAESLPIDADPAAE